MGRTNAIRKLFIQKEGSYLKCKTCHQVIQEINIDSLKTHIVNSHPKLIKAEYNITKKRKGQSTKDNRKKPKYNKENDSSNEYFNLDKESELYDKEFIIEKDLISIEEIKRKEIINEKLKILHEAIEMEIQKNDEVTKENNTSNQKEKEIIEENNTSNQTIIDIENFKNQISKLECELSEEKNQNSKLDYELRKEKYQISKLDCELSEEKIQKYIILKENEELKENENEINSVLKRENESLKSELFNLKKDIEHLKNNPILKNIESEKEQLKKDIELKNQMYVQSVEKYNIIYKHYQTLYNAYNKLKEVYNSLIINEEKYKIERDLLNKYNIDLTSINLNLAQDVQKMTKKCNENVIVIHKIKEEMKSMKKKLGIEFYSVDAIEKLVVESKQNAFKNRNTSEIAHLISFLGTKLREMKNFESENKRFIDNYKNCSENIPNYVNAIKDLQKFRSQLDENLKQKN